MGTILLNTNSLISVHFQIMNTSMNTVSWAENSLINLELKVLQRNTFICYWYSDKVHPDYDNAKDFVIACHSGCVNKGTIFIFDWFMTLSVIQSALDTVSTVHSVDSNKEYIEVCCIQYVVSSWHCQLGVRPAGGAKQYWFDRFISSSLNIENLIITKFYFLDI